MVSLKKPGIKIPRPRRIKFMNPNDGYYHIVSRALQKEMRFGEGEKKKFLTLLKWLAKVYFVRIATFCILDNHVHIVLKMVSSDDVSERELEERLQIYYEQGGPPQGMEEAFEQGDVADYYAHFSDISMFMWDLKLRFARWYNKVHYGYGHVWAERFTSILVVGRFALRACMIYVELNSCRAKLVERPEEYPYCGLAHLLKEGRNAAWLDQQLLHEAVNCYNTVTEDRGSPEMLVQSYRRAVYREGLQQDCEPASPKRESQCLSLEDGKNCNDLAALTPHFLNVFQQRIEAMTNGDYIDDIGVCNDLFPLWWANCGHILHSQKRVLTLPDGIPLDQLTTMLNRSKRPQTAINFSQ